MEANKPKSINPRNLSLRFEIHPAKPFKNAIEALSDTVFNPSNVGFVEAGKETFEITVINRDNAVGILRFFASGLSKFQNKNYPTGKKLFYMRQISAFLSAYAKDDDLISVYHVRGSNVLCFAAGAISGPGEKLSVSVELHETPIRDLRVPKVTYSREDLVASKTLRVLSQLLERSDSKIVEIVFGDHRLCFTIESKHGSEGIYSGETVKKGAVPGEHHRVVLFWSQYQTLNKASYVADAVHFCVLHKPVNSMVVKLVIGELGELIYLKGCSLVESNKKRELVSQGTETEAAASLVQISNLKISQETETDAAASLVQISEAKTEGG